MSSVPGVPAIAPRHAPSPDRPVRATDPALRAFCDAPTGKSAALPKGIIVVPGGGHAPRPTVAWRAGRPARSYWKVSAMAVVLVALLAGVVRLVGLSGVGPLNYDGYADAASQAPAASAPAGHGVIGANRADALGSPWQAGAFSVPQLGGGGAAAPGALAAAPTPVPPKPTAAPAAPAAQPAASANAAPPASGILPAPFMPWPPSNPWMMIAGHAPYRVYDYAGDPYASAFGQCTWWAQYERRDENFRGMGNARYWAANAVARGYRVGGTPAANATVVFQPYAQGASPVGHVGHVLAVYPDGWFLLSEMNAFGNGGGWGRVSYRYAHAGPGISFIY
jgi:surface antigen